MDNINFRIATKEDLDEIINLNFKLFELEKLNYDKTLIANWPNTSKGKEYFSDMIENNFVMVAVVKEKIVGYLAGSINEKCSYEEFQYGEINNMFIEEDVRGNRIGTHLIDSFKNYLKERNINNIKVVASITNKHAINFYKKNGFDDFNLTLTAKI